MEHSTDVGSNILAIMKVPSDSVVQLLFIFHMNFFGLSSDVIHFNWTPPPNGSSTVPEGWSAKAGWDAEQKTTY